MSNQNNNRTSLTPIRLFRMPENVNNNNNIQNFNKTFTPLIANSFNHNKISDFSLNTNNVIPSKNKIPFHPMEFYALGKLPCGTSYPKFTWNKGIKSTSNNIIERNALSINTKKFNQLYIYKNLSSLSQQNVTENNYMKPVKLYKTTEKYTLPKNATNFETYKIMKEKIFSKDIQSTVSKGKLLNKTDYIKEKEKAMKKKDEVQFKKIEEIKDSKVQDNNDSISYDKKSKTSTGFFFKDPNDYSKKLLKNNTFYFEQNSNQMMKPKKWKFQGKK